MDTYRRNAVIVGVLYIIGTVSGVLSVVFTKPILDAPDYLARISASGSPIITGALFVLTMGLALAMVPVAIFPILKKHNELLALGYVVFRGALETVTYLVVVISFLLLASLGQAAAQSAASEASGFSALGDVLLKAYEAGATTTEIVFPLGALMLYSALYQSKLIPRWLSGWGAIGVALHLVGGFLHMYGVIGSMSTIQDILALPIFVQEMVMAVWLIVKGFNSSAIADGSARVGVN